MNSLSMRYPEIVIGTFIVLAAASNAAAQSVIVQATFDADAQGWLLRTTNTSCALGPLVGIAANYRADGGNPGGYLEHIDPRENRTAYFRSPIPPAKSAFVGDLSAAYGGVLSYDLRQSPTSNQYNEPDILLIGGGLTLLFDTQYNPRTTWTSYAVPLRAGAGWRVDRCDGAPATEAQLRQVLASVETWLIRCEFRTGGDTDGIDNITVWSPGPSADVPESTFDTDIEGWWVFLDGVPSWNASGGVPGGCLQGDDVVVGQGYAFLAPEKFLGDHAGALGRTLEFDLRASPGSDAFPGAHLVLISNGQTEIGFIQRRPIAGNVWRHHAIPLVPGADWYRIADGLPASVDDMQAVLSGIWFLSIRGEYRTGDEVEFLDNVRLGSCNPSVVASPPLTEPCTGDDITLSAFAGGEAPLFYQWRRDGLPIDPVQNPTAVSPTLIIDDVGRSDRGVYTCVVTNACGEATSNTANVTYCVTDINCDTVSNSTDVSDFINSWFADQAKGTLVTDWDANGVVNSTDVSAFINDWFADAATECSG